MYGFRAVTSVTDSRTRRDGRSIEIIGRYHPKEEPSLIEINSERAQYWLAVGAQPTEPVLKLLLPLGFGLLILQGLSEIIKRVAALRGDIATATSVFTLAFTSLTGVVSGFIPGTSRKLIFATAFAGITVFAPAPINPPGMPCTSIVGRDHVRSSTLNISSPTSAGDPTSVLR